MSKMLMVTKVTVTHRMVLKDLGGAASLESDGIGNHYRRNIRKSTKDNGGGAGPKAPLPLDCGCPLPLFLHSNQSGRFRQWYLLDTNGRGLP